MMVATCLAILAVDFRIFPRRFAKVENWGTSLMDLGVGSFVFSGGVVSARSVAKGRVRKSAGAPLPTRLASSIRHSVPLLILGLIRLYSVKGLDYAEHVTEYGVHWNFFFTLGLMGPFVEVFHSLTAVIPSYEILSLLICVVYQVLLESTDLKEYILVSPRGPSLLSKNREGVFSFLGYLAIFLAGRGTGLRVVSRDTTRPPQQARKALLIRLAAWSAVWIVLFKFNSSYMFGWGASLPVSRRLANMPYVLWTVAFNQFQILLCCLVETIFFPSVHKATDKQTETERSDFATSRILRAFNKNGLAIFLVANLLTGAVNLGMDTLDANNYVAMGVLVGYAGIVTGLALALDYWDLRLRL
jgi:phosphatidylinositol glycan class W